MALLNGTFVATGQSPLFLPNAGMQSIRAVPGFNTSGWGIFVAAVQLERSFDGNVWLPLTAAGTQLYKWTTPWSENVQEDETGVLYRLNCTVFTSGTVNYRLSQ